MKKLPSHPPSVWRPVNLSRFLLGVAHYPEHVDRSCWERDAERMAKAGVRVVRMGEFAWHMFEPREGCLDFSLFDDAIASLAGYGIDTILCTPTATPPRWLTARYPEVLRVDENGRSASHGSRQHGDTASPVLREHSRRITGAMAKHYAHNPHVIGWQTDNELNTSASRSYSEATRRDFQRYLEDRYKTIDALNAAWGGNFWATAFQAFDQIVLPVSGAPVSPGPGHVQDYHRFLAFATARFQSEQVAILRSTNPDWFIFHNLGRLDDIDFRGDFSKDLDFLGYDVYPFLYDETQRLGGAAVAQALSLDLFRGFAGNFIVPEQQSGFGAQPSFSTLTPEPGEMRRMAFSSVARGADGILFFRWRPAHFGAEIYWMGILDHDDVPRRRYDELARFTSDIASIEDEVLGTHVRMDVAIAGGDFDNQEAHSAFPMGLPSPLDDASILYRHCYEKGIACGFVHPEDDLAPLKVLYVPHWVIWDEAWSEKVEAFVRAGGTAVFGARTGTRDHNNHVIRETAPGSSLSRLCGITVEEIGRLAPIDADGLFPLSHRGSLNAVRPKFAAESASRRPTLTIDGSEIEAAHFYERLRLQDDVETLASWSSRFLSGEPAVTCRKVGAGQAIYVATYLTDVLVEPLWRSILSMAGAKPLLADLPRGVEIAMRQCDDRQLLFLTNTQAASVLVNGVPAAEPLVLDGRALDGTVTLDPYGCAVLRLREPLGA
ncbi:beta-galactosidase [Consotaella aegiceratis]|uniref:beta-galactosidase n=1 Tax=Consotaella aegiceratis TaxID=3097961 RepID=UPI002F41199E